MSPDLRGRLANVYFYKLRPEQNGSLFADEILKSLFFRKKFSYFDSHFIKFFYQKTSWQYVSNGWGNDFPSHYLNQCWPSSQTHNWASRPQWVYTSPNKSKWPDPNLSLCQYCCQLRNWRPKQSKYMDLLQGFWGHSWQWTWDFPWVPYYGSTLITAWISNYIHYKVWNEITYPFLNFNGATVEV